MIFRNKAAGAGLAAMIVLGWAISAPLGAQIDPGEVSARTGDYVPRTQPRFRTESALVEVGVVVRDRQERSVAGLRK